MREAPPMACLMWRKKPENCAEETADPVDHTIFRKKRKREI